MSEEAKEKCRASKVGELNPNFGRTGNKSKSYKGDIIATNINTGEQIVLRSPKEMRDNGFTPASIYGLLTKTRKKRHTHKNHSFIRREQ